MSTSTSSIQSVKIIRADNTVLEREHLRLANARSDLIDIIYHLERVIHDDHLQALRSISDDLMQSVIFIADLTQSAESSVRRSFIQQAAAAKQTSPPSDEPKTPRKRTRIISESIICPDCGALCDQDVCSACNRVIGEKVSPVDPNFEDEDVQVANRTIVFHPKKSKKDIKR
jgi:hypothetical protein